MEPASRKLHDEAIVIDCLEISNWSENVFRNMRKGGLTAVNCTVSVLENFRQTINNIAWWRKAFSRHADMIMPVKTVGQSLIWYTPRDYLIRCYVVTEAMLDLHDRPDFVDACVQRLASKSILSTEAVTQTLPVCFSALTEAHMSIQYINCPPNKVPSWFVWFGNTSSVIVICDSLTLRATIS